jgi:hypothetical protein
MLFVVIALDKKDGLALRMATRKAHFEWAEGTAKVKIGGPFLNEKGEMVGSLIIFEAADLAAAKAWHAEDPYVKAGLFASSEVRPWKLTFNPVGADI